MNIIQTIGIISILVLFALVFWIAINPISTSRTLRATGLWTSIYIFFLFFLGLLRLINVGTIDQLRIIANLSTLIPLFGVVIQLLVAKKLEDEVNKVIHHDVLK